MNMNKCCPMQELILLKYSKLMFRPALCFFLYSQLIKLILCSWRDNVRIGIILANLLNMESNLILILYTVEMSLDFSQRLSVFGFDVKLLPNRNKVWDLFLQSIHFVVE